MTYHKAKASMESTEKAQEYAEKTKRSSTSQVQCRSSLTEHLSKSHKFATQRFKKHRLGLEIKMSNRKDDRPKPLSDNELVLRWNKEKQFATRDRTTIRPRLTEAEQQQSENQKVKSWVTFLTNWTKP